MNRMEDIYFSKDEIFSENQDGGHRQPQGRPRPAPPQGSQDDPRYLKTQESLKIQQEVDFQW